MKDDEDKKFVQDQKFKQQMELELNWEHYKRVQCQQIIKEKKFRKSRFEGLLRTDFNLNYKRHFDYSKDGQILSNP